MKTYIYMQNLYYYINEIHLYLCYLMYFFNNKIAIIKKKSNLTHLKTNHKLFAYC